MGQANVFGRFPEALRASSRDVDELSEPSHRFSVFEGQTSKNLDGGGILRVPGNESTRFREMNVGSCQLGSCDVRCGEISEVETLVSRVVEASEQLDTS